MRRCYWLLNHRMLEKQKKELEERYGICEFIMPPDDIAVLWKAIPVEKEIPQSFFDRIEDWLRRADGDDVVVIQGEPTAAFLIVSHLLKRGVTVLAGITERRSIDKEENGTVIKTSLFDHVCFRKYTE